MPSTKTTEALHLPLWRALPFSKGPGDAHPHMSFRTNVLSPTGQGTPTHICLIEHLFYRTPVRPWPPSPAWGSPLTLLPRPYPNMSKSLRLSHPAQAPLDIRTIPPLGSRGRDIHICSRTGVLALGQEVIADENGTGDERRAENHLTGIRHVAHDVEHRKHDAHVKGGESSDHGRWRIHMMGLLSRE